MPLLIVVLSLALMPGCRSRAPVADDQPGVRADAAGHVVLAADSPVREGLRIEAVRTETWSDQLELPSRVQPDPRRVWRVVLPVPGRVVDVHVMPGDAVRSGQPLLTLVSPEADTIVAAARHAEADRRAAQAAVRQAEADLERLRDLLEHDAVARRDVLHAETVVAQAEAELARANATVAQSSDTLSALGLAAGTAEARLVVRAPRAGRVSDVAVAAGEFHADTSAALLQIADLSTVWVVSDIPEHRVAAVRAQEAVEVQFVALPGETIAGRIARVGNAVDAETRTLKVYIELSNPDERLRPEMFATVRVDTARQNVPVIPIDAVVRSGDGSVVVIEHPDDGRFMARPVQTGRPRAGRVPILTGLEAGERIVVDGALLLINVGVRVPAGPGHDTLAPGGGVEGPEPLGRAR